MARLTESLHRRAPDQANVVHRTCRLRGKSDTLME